MTFTIPATDENPRMARSLSETVGGSASFVMTIVGYIVLGFMVFIVIAAVIDKIVEVVTGSPPKTPLVDLLIAPIEKVLNAIGNAIAAPFSGIAKIFNTSWYRAMPLGTAFYYIVLVAIPVVALAVWFIWRRR